MDPNANLREQLELARTLVGPWPDEQQAEREADAVRLAELVVALDEWIQKGGWKFARRRELR